MCLKQGLLKYFQVSKQLKICGNKKAAAFYSNNMELLSQNQALGVIRRQKLTL